MEAPKTAGGITATAVSILGFLDRSDGLTASETVAALAMATHAVLREMRAEAMTVAPLERELAREACEAVAAILAAQGDAPLRPVDPAPETLEAARGDDVLANGPGLSRQVRGRVAYRVGDAVAVREWASGSLVEVPAAALVRNFTRNGQAAPAGGPRK